jgi:hypothetical protein
VTVVMAVMAVRRVMVALAVLVRRRSRPEVTVVTVVK